MNAEERQALRERHSKIHVCGFGNFPCDVIKVLDWADEVLDELKGLTAHFEGIWY